ncbi:hypothetical protein LWF01_04345 [Saxibacter everestensis]|uniref:CopG family transcriptional regulator n=1 Tax=Saxibacter everestensis TaxID=2909229 RepID=A0ABY8QW22_9MICO|nr:hypothetical protein LWF01_04345 [Brevibacteriaceae bacterium ZFBP1038]
MALNLRLSEEQDAALTRLAKEQGTSKQVAATTAIMAAADAAERKLQFDAALDEILNRDAGLLKRLAE